MFESVQVDLQDITLLEQVGRDNLINFANSGIGQIDYDAYLTEVGALVSQYRDSHLLTKSHYTQDKGDIQYVRHRHT